MDIVTNFNFCLQEGLKEMTKKEKAKIEAGTLTPNPRVCLDVDPM